MFKRILFALTLTVTMTAFAAADYTMYKFGNNLYLLDKLTGQNYILTTTDNNVIWHPIKFQDSLSGESRLIPETLDELNKKQTKVEIVSEYTQNIKKKPASINPESLLTLKIDPDAKLTVNSSVDFTLLSNTKLDNTEYPAGTIVKGSIGRIENKNIIFRYDFVVMGKTSKCSVNASLFATNQPGVYSLKINKIVSVTQIEQKTDPKSNG